MRVRLIQPSQYDASGKVTKFRKLFFPSLTLPTLAALTPPGIEVGITTEYVEDIDFDEDVDLVGVTAQTCQAPRAYRIAAEFRKRGRRTIMGGIHASACPDEALEHFDAVLIGEAENIWPVILDDLRSGRMSRVYRSEQRPDLRELAIPRYDLLNYKHYVVPPFARTPLMPVQTTRGCPHGCDFCSVTKFWGPQFRKKPVANVMREIEAIRPSRIFFADDNIGADPRYAKELFQALKPLKLRWACQMSTTIMTQPDLIELAGEAGCHETLLGIESLNHEALASVHKSFNKVANYQPLLSRLKDAGILAQVSVIFGLDGDTGSSLTRTIDTLLEWDANYIYLAILTPFPGTDLYDRLQRAGRIRVDDWSMYDVTRVVFQPTNVTPQELEETVWDMYRKCYDTRNIARRAWRFRKQYLCHFPRDNVAEELFFQIQMRNSIRRRTHPFSLGLGRITE